MSVTHRVIYRGVSVTTGLSRGPSHTARCRSVSVTQHRVISWYVSHTACPPSMSVTHCVIYRSVSVTTGLSCCPSHTARCRSVFITQHHVISWYVSHTACPPSMSVTHRVIYRGVSVTTGLSHSLSHTARCRSVSVTQHHVISWYVSHTACPPSMLVTHRVIYRSVLVTTGLSCGPARVSITYCVISRWVRHTAHRRYNHAKI